MHYPAFFSNIVEKSGIDALVNGVGKGINYSGRQITIVAKWFRWKLYITYGCRIIIVVNYSIVYKIKLMLGNYYTFPELLLWIPLLTGIIVFFIKDSKAVKTFALVSSLVTLVVSVISLFYSDVAHHPEYFDYNNVSYVWMPYLGSSFSVGLDGMGFLLTFLTAFTFPLIFAATRKT